MKFDKTHVEALIVASEHALDIGWKDVARRLNEIRKEIQKTVSPPPRSSMAITAPIMLCEKHGKVIATWHFFDDGPEAECPVCHARLTRKAEKEGK